MSDKPNTIRVVSAVADTKKAILYLEDGNQLILNQGDHRLGNLLEIIIPITVRGEVAEVNLENFSIYANFEKNSSGLTKFYRVAKSLVSGFFGSKKEEEPEKKEIDIDIPEEGRKDIIAAVNRLTAEEVVEHGQEIKNDDAVTDDDVVVAVVTNPVDQSKTAIPGVGAIKPLIEHAVRSNSTVAVENFLARCAKFIDKRQHSVEDLMRFLEKGDLPLAEDGSIIAYKMLNRAKDNNSYYVDCHTGKVRQRVGSYVKVNENLVDLNRRNECSNGLHIARRGYLKSFGGNVCVLCKIDPEDVMVVPHNDANKVRVKGYFILAELSDAALKLLKSNEPMTGEEDALKIVYRAIKGDHIRMIEIVQINGQSGTDVTVTPCNGKKSSSNKQEAPNSNDLKKAAALDDKNNDITQVNPRDINKQVTEEHKKALDEKEKNASTPDPKPETKSKTKAKSKPKKPAVTKPISKAVQKAAEEHPKTKALKAKETKNENAKPVGSPLKPTPTGRTNADEAKTLYERWIKTSKMNDFETLLYFKQKKKKSWEALGFTPAEIEKITSKK